VILDFKEEGDVIFQVGESQNDIASSEYLSQLHNVELSPAPHFVLEEEAKVQDAVSDLITSGLIRSAHDISEGGLLVCLIESSMINDIGF